MSETKPLVLITGASSGIGAGIAKIFSKTGYPLGLLARNRKAMEDLKLPQTICLDTDVTDVQTLQKALKQCEKEFGSIDCLINNAGFSQMGEFTTLSHKDHEAMVQVNLLGMINTIETVLPGMQKRQAGTIINISSLADRKSRPNLAVYAATKAGVKSLSDSLSSANAKYGIRICNVAPAKIKTSLLKPSQLSEDQLISVDDFAKTILWIYQQPQHICIRDMVVTPTYYEG